MAKVKVFTDSCSDLSQEIREKNNIGYFRMNVVVAGEEHPADLDWKEFSPEQLYAWVGDVKNHCKTTMVPAVEFETKIRETLKEGFDLVYISCSSKLTGSLNVFQMVREDLEKEFPERKIIGVDSLCACLGEGFITVEANKLALAGKSAEEIVKWVEDNRLKMNQFATVSSLRYLKEAGRVSGASAVFGDLLGIKPILISDVYGHNVAITKAKGEKKAIRTIVDQTKELIDLSISKTVYIGQGMAQEQAAKLKELLVAELGVEVEEYWIGPIIGTSCGPGVYAVYFWGKEVTYQGEDAK